MPSLPGFILIKPVTIRMAPDAHLRKDQPLEFVFGDREGENIRFRILGRTCPDADSVWYAAQVNAEIYIQAETFSGYRSSVMFSDDFHLFVADLESLLCAESVGAWLESGDFLSVQVRRDGNTYSCWMQLDALELESEMVLRDEGAKNWEWRLGMDRTALDALIHSVTQISDRYPTWSVPRS